jgi:high-affinity iron transporter
MNRKRRSRRAQGRIFVLCLLAFVASLCADAIDESATLQNVLDEALLDVHGGRWSPAIAENLQQASSRFAQALTHPEASELWDAPLPVSIEGLLPTAEALGFMQARQQHVAALEMISNQRAGNIEAAREWRSIIKLPKFASSVEGALALQRLGGNPTQRAEVSRLLAREYAIWQITRAREKADALMRLIHEGRATPALLYARASEIQGLSNLPGLLVELATGAAASDNLQSESDFSALLGAAREGSNTLPELAADW